MFCFINDTATTEIYTLSLHDALPISRWTADRRGPGGRGTGAGAGGRAARGEPPAVGHPRAVSPSVPERAPDRSEQLPERQDRKSTRLNFSHANIPYAVFCLKKKTNQP